MVSEETTSAPDDEPQATKRRGRKGKKAGAHSNALSVATHPRAGNAVRRAKGIGGIAGFALAALIAHKAGDQPQQVLERALISGVAGYLLAWACAVTVWRHIVLAELRARVERATAAQHETVAPTAALPAPNSSDGGETRAATPPAPAQLAAPSAG